MARGAERSQDGRPWRLPGQAPGYAARGRRRDRPVRSARPGGLIDWTLCQFVAYAVFSVPFGEAGPRWFVPLALFAVENLLLVGTLGYTIGHRIVGLRVRSCLEVRQGPSR